MQKQPMACNLNAVSNTFCVIRVLLRIPIIWTSLTALINSDSVSGDSFVFSPDADSTPIFTADETEDYLYRFIDTTSRIDIRTFKGAFSSSLNSVESITFDLNIYESDSQNRTMAFSSNYYL